jgi:MFS family permease
MIHIIDDARAKRNVGFLVAAQAILGSQMPMLFVIGGLAGSMLTPNPCLATLPISMIVFGSMTTAPWISPLMQRRGRRLGFVIGTSGGALGAAVAAYALFTGSFYLLLLGSYLSGIYMSAQGFYRFAAADSASDAFRPKAISYVMAGGLGGAIIGPQLNNLLEGFSVVPFLGSYLAIIALNVVGSLLFLGLDLPALGAPKKGAVVEGRTRKELFTSAPIVVAVICAMVAYALMNLVMTSTPLAVVGCGFSMKNANDIVSAHVLAMFIPSFFTGHLISYFGVKKVIAAGLICLGAAGVVGLSGVQLGNFYLDLILLGIGWNFGFIGGTALLTASHAPNERGRVQGLNDLLVFGCVTIASLASGGLMNCSGGSVVEGWTAVNLAMVPFLTLAGATLIWLALRGDSVDQKAQAK